MSLKHLVSNSLNYLRISVVALTVLELALGPLARPLQAQQDFQTQTPIKHVIVIIGENRSFDHLFATYKPVAGETVDNLLSKQIIKEDGTPGPNFSLATQFSAADTATFRESPMSKSLYSTLPAPLVGGPIDVCKDNKICTLTDATSSENGLPSDYYTFLLPGGAGAGQTKKAPALRIPIVNNLPPGPFQLSSNSFPYDSYAASPVHRFYQMWQQLDCNVYYATIWNPSGCEADLFPWVETTVGAGANGLAQPAGFSNLTTGEGSTGHGLLQRAAGRR